LNYKFGSQFDQKLKQLDVWGLNWTWNYLINEIKDPIIKCQKFMAKLKIIISGETNVIFNEHCSSSSHPEDQINKKHS